MQLPSPGGGRIPMITSPEQEAKRQDLKKISFGGGGGGGNPMSKPKKPGLGFPSFNPPGGGGGGTNMSDIEKRERGKFLIMKARLYFCATFAWFLRQ